MPSAELYGHGRIPIGKYIRDRLLDDRWGNWHCLDPEFLERLSERMGEICQEYIDQLPKDHENCEPAEDYNRLYDDVEKLQKTLEEVEERERALLTGRYGVFGTVRL